MTQNKCKGSQVVPQASGQVGLLHLNRPVGVHGSPLLVVLELGEVGGQLATGLHLVDKLSLLHLVDLGGEVIEEEQGAEVELWVKTHE